MRGDASNVKSNEFDDRQQIFETRLANVLAKPQYMRDRNDQQKRQFDRQAADQRETCEDTQQHRYSDEIYDERLSVRHEHRTKQ
jgi:hypothetical protein